MWKIIKDFENYEINELGQVRNAKSHVVLKDRPTNCGYVRVVLYKNGKPKDLSIHRLVAETFIPQNDLLKSDVNHINGMKTDNRVENLEWVTKSENIRHAQDIGLKTYDSISRQIAVIKKGKKRIFKNSYEASAYVGCSHQYISKLARNGKFFNGFAIEYA